MAEYRRGAVAFAGFFAGSIYVTSESATLQISFVAFSPYTRRLRPRGSAAAPEAPKRAVMPYIRAAVTSAGRSSRDDFLADFDERADIGITPTYFRQRRRQPKEGAVSQRQQRFRAVSG